MAAATKPTQIVCNWAESGDSVEPSDGMKASGWPEETTPPSRAKFNWLFGWLTQGMRYLIRRGLVDYDNAETYAIGDRVQYTDGKTYKCIQAGTGNLPTDVAYWVQWGHTATELTAALTALGSASDTGITAGAGGSLVADSGLVETVGSVKTVSYALTVSITYKIGSCEVTLSSTAAFATAAKNAHATLDKSGTDIDSFVSAEITGANKIKVYVHLADTVTGTATVYVTVKGV